MTNPWPGQVVSALVCPRCGGKIFDPVDCGPDSLENGFAYTSYRCVGCRLWFDGLTDSWYADIDGWQDVYADGTEEYKP